MKHKHSNWLLPLVALLSLFVFVPTSQAVSVSPQMVEQFKRLPASEQQRLAKQYGIDPAMLGGAAGGNSSYQEVGSAVVQPRSQKSISKSEIASVAPKANKLKPYGYELFAGQPSTFAPATDIPVPSDYVLGPGDELTLQLYGKENATHNLTVGRDGSVMMPELAPIHIAGLSFGEARKTINGVISEQMVNVNSNVTMGQLRSIRIFIAGEAYQPGSYTVSALSTVSHAITLAGGLSEIGSLRNIQVKRNGKVVGHFDAYDLLLRGDASGDVRLQSGDVVFIPPLQATVSVDGDVRRPAIYELVDSVTMADALAMAGGALAGAYPAASIVERYNGKHQRSIVNVDLTTAAGKRMAVANGDSLIVRSTSSDVDGAITLVGAVARPGHYQWQMGMTISDILRSPSADLTWNTDFSYALVVRKQNIRGDIAVLGFDLEDALIAPKGDDDLLLKPSDSIVVFAERDEALDRRALGKLMSALSKKQHLQNAKLTNSQDEDVISQGLDSKLKFRSEIAGVAVVEDRVEQHEDGINAELKSLALLQLFQHDELIAISNTLTRDELLQPVLAKLKSQARLNKDLKIVAVDGEVMHPGDYPLLQGATVKDLIAIAGGLKESAFEANAEITRSQQALGSAKTVFHLNLSLTEELNGSRATALKSRDRLNVLTKPEWTEVVMVELRGEVRFPGKYAIKKGNTLADVIVRAGGFTEYAYTYGGVFTRESVRKQEQLEIQRVVTNLRKEMANRTLSEQGNFASVQDTQVMLSQLEQVKATGRMVVNFDQVLDNNPKHNLIAENGDLVYIPPVRQTIAVMGEVQHPSSHRYDDALSISDYMKLAGGSSTRADTDRLYVVRADGSVMLPKSNFWFTSNNQQLKPGDTIIMPLKSNYKDGLTLWSQVTGIIYNTAVAVAAISGL
ncbi:SLBB domain-containing protein [uncultured Ferrimonas sp.]|uniref:polysaccharide biosynthesis/export family protein n=1 Tax=uncultured Ferrimonas sp. TaxID=432640 RepID=UPI0026108630|nr:SLBB domain-containing protein [uncultured Ferrimonas sp.]